MFAVDITFFTLWSQPDKNRIDSQSPRILNRCKPGDVTITGVNSFTASDERSAALYMRLHCQVNAKSGHKAVVRAHDLARALIRAEPKFGSYEIADTRRQTTQAH